MSRGATFITGRTYACQRVVTALCSRSASRASRPVTATKSGQGQLQHARERGRLALVAPATARFLLRPQVRGQVHADGVGDVLGGDGPGDPVLAQGPGPADEFPGEHHSTPARAVSSGLLGAVTPRSQAMTRSGVTYGSPYEDRMP